MAFSIFRSLFSKNENNKDKQAEIIVEDNVSDAHLRAAEFTNSTVNKLLERFIAVSIKAENKKITEISAANYIRCIPSGTFEESINEEISEKKLIEDLFDFVGISSNTIFVFFDLSSAEIFRDACKWNNIPLDIKYVNVGEAVHRLYPFRNDKKFDPYIAYSYFNKTIRDTENYTAAECVGMSLSLMISDEHMAAAMAKINSFSGKKPERRETLSCDADIDTDYLDAGMEITMEYSNEKRRNILVCNTKYLCIADNELLKIMSEKTNRKVMFISDIKKTKKAVFISVNIYSDLPALPFGFQDKQRYRV